MNPRIHNKYVNQQIHKKFKNRHRNGKKIHHKKLKTVKRAKADKAKAYISKTKHKSSKQSKQFKQYIELKYKSTDIFTLNDYIKPNPKPTSHYIPHDNYYSLNDILKYTKNKNKNNTHYINYNSSKNEQNACEKYELYNEKYLLSNNDCKWIKLKRGKFFNSSFYIFNNDNDIHSVEIIEREQQQNINCITYFLQNLVEEIYPYTNIILSQDIAYIIGEFCRGYLTAKCYNDKCNKYINFFYEDRYNGINTYFYLSYHFEDNNIIYCSDCICTINKCECGNTDLNHQFNKYLCYNYNENETITIDEFKCECNGHQLCCSKHIKCIQCGLSPCNECELFGWGVNNKNGLCIKCDKKNINMIECNGCYHIFDEYKINNCILCKKSYCDNIKWKQFDMNINKSELSEKYNMYLNKYKCECNWKEKYFDAPHNLLYSVYSEWKRTMELKDNKCEMEKRLTCLECDELFAVCKQCDYSNNKMIICDKCSVNNKIECNLCEIDFIQCYEYNINDIIYYGLNQLILLNHMIKRECIECDEIYYICNGCYNENYGEYFGLYLCMKCKYNNKRKCMYCNDIYYNHILWDKIMGGIKDRFRYFMDDIQCKNKGCKCNIKNICNICYDIYNGECLQCLNGSVCVKCNKNNYNGSLCELCCNEDLYLSKINNCFKSNWIDKKWKNNRKKRNGNKSKQRRSKLNKDGKFIYNITYNRHSDGFGHEGIKISSKWKKYKKGSNKRRC